MKLTRRGMLATIAVAAHGYNSRFRYAVCNETFAGSSFAEGCRLAKKAGYTGIEIAPGTLAGDPSTLTVQARKEFRRTLEGEGLTYAGLHSLMTAPAGLHLTTPDSAIRQRSWDFFRTLIDLSGDLGKESVMVLGSGKQRAAVQGSSAADAKARLTDGLATMAPHARERNVELLLEPLSPQFTDVVNTVSEAVDIAKKVNSPALASMFDTHNTVAEKEPHDEVIRQYARWLRHVHVNELDGRHPGTGEYNFGLVLQALRDVNYRGWISLEVFQFKPSGETIAADSLAFLQKTEHSLEGKTK